MKREILSMVVKTINEKRSLYNIGKKDMELLLTGKELKISIYHGELYFSLEYDDDLYESYRDDYMEEFGLEETPHYGEDKDKFEEWLADKLRAINLSSPDSNIPDKSGGVMITNP